MKPIVIISRVKQDENQTTGLCTVTDSKNNLVFAALSLERGWRDNQASVSCIPPGQYELVLEYSDRFKKDLWEIKGVENRSECKFHSANYWHQLQGCISLGLTSKFINEDEYRDISNSGDAMGHFHDVLKNYKEVMLIVE